MIKLSYFIIVEKRNPLGRQAESPAVVQSRAEGRCWHEGQIHGEQASTWQGRGSQGKSKEAQNIGGGASKSVKDEK